MHGSRGKFGEEPPQAAIPKIEKAKKEIEELSKKAAIYNIKQAADEMRKAEVAA